MSERAYSIYENRTLSPEKIDIGEPKREETKTYQDEPEGT